MVYYIVSVLFLLFFWCPCMAINVSVQFDGGLIPDITLMTQSMLLPSENPFKCHEEFFGYLQLLIPPKRFDIFSPLLGDAQKFWAHSDFSFKKGYGFK